VPPFTFGTLIINTAKGKKEGPILTLNCYKKTNIGTYMGLNDISRSLGHGIGKLVGTTRKVLSWPGSTLSKAMEKLRSVFPSAKIRSIVLEELARSQGTDQKITLAQLEERLRLMADTIEAIQKRILELSGRGLEHEALVAAAMASVENVSLLNEEERVILTNIFRQNLEIQKPELVDSLA
jgi:hypothetical protein